MLDIISASVDTADMDNNERQISEVKVRGYGWTEDEAFQNAVRVADRKFRIFDAKSIRKVRNQDAWDVTFRVESK